MTYTVNDVCQRYGVGIAAVLGWIRSGELAALNVARSAAAKTPRWRITEEALAAFELRRSSEPPPQPTRKRRKGKSPLVIDRY